jgi:prepilin-type N-terminal cleavage/methylation domain-containing protein
MKGFTLIELIVYIGIFAIILVSITGFLWLIVLGNVKESAFQEVQHNGRFALAKITHEIRKAKGINYPILGDVPTDSLSLIMADDSLTVFEIINEKLIITQGSPGISYDLTSDQVVVNSLQFTNNSYQDTPGIIQTKIEIIHVNPSNLKEYQASINLQTSVSLLPPGQDAP